MPSSYVPLRGGLTLSTSPLDVYPGALKESLNYYEDIKGGYTRINGYERYDGKLAPSDNTYYFARFNNWDTKVTDILADTSITVAATIAMRVLYVDITTEADTMIAVVCSVDEDTIPTDLDDVPLSWDGTSYLTSITPRAATTDALDEAYLEATWDYTRGLIGEIPGTAVPAGCLQIDDKVVAFRTDTTTPKVYYSTATGWTEGTIGRVAEITSYTADDIFPGETIAGATFRVAAVCEWYDTAGVSDVTKAWLVLIPLTAAAAPSTGASTASGGASFTIASVINPIDDWGTYIEYAVHNFLTDPEALAAWFCDGTNVLMCYNSTYNCVLPVSANYNTIAGTLATSVGVLDDQLMYATGSGSFIISEPGNPFNYGGLYGSAEIGVGAVITDMEESDGDNLIVYTQRGAKKLAGTDAADFTFKTAAGNVGAEPRSVQKLDDLYSFSTRGVNQLRRTEAQGGYLGGSVSTHIAESLEGLAALLTCSTVLQSKEQLRWYFSDSQFLVMTRMVSDQGERYSFAFCEYPSQPVRSVSTLTWTTGIERTFFTSDTGYVYESDKGTNFDGSPITSFVELHSNHLGDPGIDKSFKRVFWEAKSTENATMVLGFSLNYGEKSFETASIEAYGGRFVYDEGVYDVARYDSAARTRSRAILKGRGFAITFAIDQTSKFTPSFNLTGYTIHFNQLGRARQ